LLSIICYKKQNCLTCKSCLCIFGMLSGREELNRFIVGIFTQQWRSVPFFSRSDPHYSLLWPIVVAWTWQQICVRYVHSSFGVISDLQSYWLAIMLTSQKAIKWLPVSHKMLHRFYWNAVQETCAFLRGEGEGVEFPVFIQYSAV